MRRSELEISGKQVALAGAIILGTATMFCGQVPASRERARPERRIVVSIPDRRLVLLEGGGVVKVYVVAVGALDSPSPTGRFKIVHCITDPTYYGPAPQRRIIPPGKENPLGTRWLGLSLKGFGIHGTNEPRSIGHRASHGCIRMRMRDAEELFERVRAGDPVEIYDERNRELAAIFGAPQQPNASPTRPTPSGQTASPVVLAAVAGR